MTKGKLEMAIPVLLRAH